MIHIKIFNVLLKHTFANIKHWYILTAGTALYFLFILINKKYIQNSLENLYSCTKLSLIVMTIFYFFYAALDNIYLGSIKAQTAYIKIKNINGASKTSILINYIFISVLLINFYLLPQWIVMFEINYYNFNNSSNAIYLLYYPPYIPFLESNYTLYYFIIYNMFIIQAIILVMQQIFDIKADQRFLNIVNSTLTVKHKQLYIYCIISFFGLFFAGLLFAGLAAHFVLPLLGISNCNLNFSDFMLWSSEWIDDYHQIITFSDKHHIYYYYFSFISVLFFIIALKNYKEFIKFIDEKYLNTDHIEPV